MDKKLLNEFANPGCQYRGAPFWAWNGKLDPRELRHQIRLMRRMGLGGFFMHSRVGLDTAYLSDEWFDCVKACIDEAGKLGMKAWLYDEDRWPSGAAGGLVTKNPKYQARHLIVEETRDPKTARWNDDVLAIYTAKVTGADAMDVKKVSKGQAPRLKNGETFLVFKVLPEDSSPWYNGHTYLDTLNHEAVREFIKITHEAYRKNVSEYFGKQIPGIFTDEPNYGHVTNPWGEGKLGTAWTGAVPRVFEKRYGYDIMPHLPALFYNVEGRDGSRVKYHYLDCITHLFSDAFCGQIGKWCEKNGILLTGHMLEEDKLSIQTNMVGSCMRSYEHMQAPGMDWLTEHWRIYDTAKQVASAAHQFGRKWRLTETYGCTGWDFPFVGHKTVGDVQAALGINLRCPHLSWYTMLGEAKRDYPAGIFYQSPWWELYPKVEDYFARINTLMTRGEEVRDLLVIHPNETMWTLIGKGWRGTDAVKDCDKMLIDLRDSLLTNNIDFDYGDEELLSRHGNIMKGKTPPLLRFGKAAYKVVVVPPLKTMRSTTLKLLKKFHSSGGLVVFAGEPAKLVDVNPSQAVIEFARACVKAPAKGGKLVEAVESHARRISITDDKGNAVHSALYLLREDKDAFYLFVCNTGHSKSQMVSDTDDATMIRDRKTGFPVVRIRGFAECDGVPLELVPDTGSIFTASALCKSNGWEINTSLPPIGSRLFVVPKCKGGKAYPRRPDLKQIGHDVLGGDKWDISLSESNVIVLDRARYKIGSGVWNKASEILRIDRAVRGALGIAPRGGAMVQPWAQKRCSDGKHIGVTLAYNFDVKAIPSGDLFLALEQPDTFTVSVNGAALSMDSDSGWWCDQSLRRFRLDPFLLRPGRNEIMLTCDYHDHHPGLEIMYVLGSFGAQVSGTDITMTRLPTALKIGDWVKQGLAFYAGSTSYCRTIRPNLRKGEHLFVQVPEYRGIAVRILVNGKSAGIIAWEPNEMDITDLLGEGPVDLRIEVIGHRRNSHGPFHINEKWPVWTGPGEYLAEGKRWFDGYQLVPCGLMAAPKLVTKR